MMADAQYKGRGVLTCFASLVHECLQVFLTGSHNGAFCLRAIGVLYG